MMTSSEPRWDEQAWDDSDDAVSSVFPSLPIVDVAVGELRSPGPKREPTPVYAAPYRLAGNGRIRFTRDFYLGTSFPTGIIAAEGWEDELRGACLPEGLIAKCRAYLAARAL